MTYKEAQQVLKDNDIVLDKYRMYLNPPHMIQGTLIAPLERSLDREQYIFIECQDNKKDNEDVLRHLNILDAELIPFVVVKMWGYNIILPLDSYLASPSSPLSEENNPQ